MGALNLTNYRYNVELSYHGGSEDVAIYTEQIKSVIIDHNYEEACMPIIFISMTIDRKMADDMIKNQNNAYFILKISAYNGSSMFGGFSGLGQSSTTIDVKCAYFINDDLNKMDPVDYASQRSNETMLGNTFTLVNVGLMVVDHLTKNKKNCALTAKKAKMQDILKDKILSDFDNLIFEDLEYNDEFEQLVIPPTVSDSVNKTLAYLNNKRVFYSTPYRFYQDFNNTYFISSSGKAINGSSSSGGGGFGGFGCFGAGLLGGGGSAFGGDSDSISIKITEVDDQTSSISGIITYLISGLLGLGGSSSDGTGVAVNYVNVQVSDNTITNKNRNTIRTVQSSGSQQTELASKSELISSSALATQRMNNDNIHMAENIAARYDSSNFLVFFAKTDLDNSLFTINKQIKIANTNRYANLNGTYLLFRKREIYTREDATYVLNTMINLRRIDSLGSENHQSGSGSFFSIAGSAAASMLGNAAGRAVQNMINRL